MDQLAVIVGPFHLNEVAAAVPGVMQAVDDLDQMRLGGFEWLHLWSLQ